MSPLPTTLSGGLNYGGAWGEVFMDIVQFFGYSVSSASVLGDLFSDSQGVVAEVFTKPLARVKFYRLICIILGLVRDDGAPTVAGLSPVFPFFLGLRQALLGQDG